MNKNSVHFSMSWVAWQKTFEDKEEQKLTPNHEYSLTIPQQAHAKI